MDTMKENVLVCLTSAILHWLIIQIVQLNFEQSYYVSKQKNKRKISLFNEPNFGLVDYTEINLFGAANFGESYYNDSKVEKESLFGQHNFEQSYYINNQNFLVGAILRSPHTEMNGTEKNQCTY